MSYQKPTNEPCELIKGDTWEWDKTLKDFSPPDWNLSYRFNKESDASVAFNVNAIPSGTYYSVLISSGTTASYADGTYSWVSRVTDGTSSFTVETGTLLVKPDPANMTGDQRSQTKFMLDLLETAIRNWASTGHINEMTAFGRTVRYNTSADLFKARDRYKWLYEQELNAEKLRRGLDDSRNIYTRFTN